MWLDFPSWPLGCVSNSACRWFGFQCRPCDDVGVVKHLWWQNPEYWTLHSLFFSSVPITLLLPCEAHVSFLFLISSFLSSFFILFLSTLSISIIWFWAFWQERFLSCVLSFSFPDLTFVLLFLFLPCFFPFFFVNLFLLALWACLI